jgi:hypothetical protein
MEATETKKEVNIICTLECNENAILFGFKVVSTDRKK